MPVAIRCALLIAALACAGCHSRSSQVANEAMASDTQMDIETLPPDESDATPTNELQNGVDEPADNSVGLNSD